MRYAERQGAQTYNPNIRQHRYIQTETNYIPVVAEDTGYSAASIGMFFIGGMTAVALLFFLLMYSQNQGQSQSRQMEIARQQLVVRQPIQPMVAHQSVSQSAPVAISQPATSALPADSMTSAERDLAIQTEIDRRIKADSELSKSNITITVSDGEVMVIGFVESNQQKEKISRMVNKIRYIKNLDNELIVSASAM